MYTLEDKININCSYKELYDKLLYFFQNTENYKEWHNDHIECKWIKGKDFEIGSILYASEILNNKIHKLKFRIIENDNTTKLKYKILFPYSIICENGSFNMIKKENLTEFVATLNFKLPTFFVKLFNGEINALRQHVKEEGISIKEIIESK